MLFPIRLFTSSARHAREKRCRGFLLSLALVLSTCLATAEQLSWFVDGQPNEAARQAVDILLGADSDGLVPGDYAAEALHSAIFSGTAAPGQLNAAAVAQFDQQMTSAMQQYLTDLHFGRIDPQQIHENYRISQSDPFDAATYLSAAIAEHRLPQATRQAAPPIYFYENLRQALARYRTLVSNPAWRKPLASFSGQKLAIGQAYSDLPLLIERLIALGDLPPGIVLPDRYAGPVVKGVQAFQERHGLTSDGVIGKATLAQLNVPPSARLRQIEVTLERLRWTPLLQGRRMVVINIPEFFLRAYETHNGKIDLQTQMKVIVGKALNTRTPVFSEDMRFIEFSPYWNVPPSIAREETIPKLRRDAHYLEEQGFEFIGNDGRINTALNSANLNAVLRGELRIRQRPGPKNALGDIKFIFPNDEHIFLHHTPTPQLFSRDRRDFSHGCIRVEAPVSLAKFVLQDEPEWTEERIRIAMAKRESVTLRLREPVRVLIAYSTVIVKNDGRIFFFPDLYGHDELLDQALHQRRLSKAAFHLQKASAQ